MEGEEAGVVFASCCPKQIREYTEGFMRVLPFSSALPLALKMADAEKRVGKYLSALTYPCLMFAAMLAGSFVFCEICFPALIGMLDGFRADVSGFRAAAAAVRTASVILSVLGIVFFLLGLFFTRKKRQVKAYRFLASLKVFRIPVEYVSSQFILFYCQCLDSDLHTRECVEVLKSMRTHPVIADMAETMERELLQGEGFEDAMHHEMFDPSLYRFLKVAVHNDDTAKIMNSYLQMSEQRLMRKCRRLSACIRTAAYSACGVLLIFVYRILMMPLTILSQM